MEFAQKSKLTVTPFTIEQVIKFSSLEYVENLVVGCDDFGLRQVKSFTLSEIKQIKSCCDSKLWIAVNKILHKDDVEKLKIYLQELEKIQVYGVIFSDLAVVYLINDMNLKLKMMYNTETTITNHYFTEYAEQLGIEGVELAKEITLNEIKEINALKKSKISTNIHGHIYMYQSARKLLTNYMHIQGKIIESKEYKLYDEERNLFYPIIENEQGTHMLAAKDLCMMNKLPKILSIGIDYLKIDGFLYTENQYDEIVGIYNNAIIDYYNNQEVDYEKLFEKIKNVTPDKSYNTGFYFKETVY